MSARSLGESYSPSKRSAPAYSEKPMPGELGKVVERELEQIPPEERLAFLAVVEQHAKERADLQMLRAIKEYRQLSIKPPKSA